MAFTGTPVVEQVSDRMVRITGVSLGIAAAGTIGLFGITFITPDVRLPESFRPEHYKYGDDLVTFNASIKVTVQSADAVSEFSMPAITKAGTDDDDWRATVTNTFGSASPGLEIYVEFHE